MLPMAKPGLATVAILNFVGLWNQFLLPIALNTNPDNYVLTQAMASFASQAGYSVDFGGAVCGRGHHRRTGADHLSPAAPSRSVTRSSQVLEQRPFQSQIHTRPPRPMRMLSSRRSRCDSGAGTACQRLARA